MDEIFRIADEITVLRDGAAITTKAVKETSIEEIISLMVGRKLENMYPKESVAIGEEEVIESKLDAILITADNVDEYLDYYVEKGALTQEEVDAVRAEVGE